MELVKVSEVDEELLREIVDRIVAAVNPEKIILFGSYAYGHPTQDSDLDLLVIVGELKEKRREIRFRIRKALRKFLIAKDIIVATENEIEDWKDVKGAFLSTVVNKGKVIYERKKRLNWLVPG